jgi:CzcA family heavy metal efflux pump
MLNRIVGYSLKFRYLVIAFAIAMMCFGYAELRKASVDVFPEFAPPMVEIQVPALGLSPTDVESQVTVPLEEGLSGTPGLMYMRSKSVPDLSSIKLYFNRNTDLMDARQMVQERVAQTTPMLPTYCSPPVMLPPLSATSRCMKIGISSKTRSVIDLSMITYWTIRQRILDVPGVANVAIWGERIEMLCVQAIPDKLKEFDLSLDDILKATNDSLESGLYTGSKEHHIGTGGWIEAEGQRLGINHVLPIFTGADKVDPKPMEEVVVAMRDGKPILMKDVARVVVDHQPMIGDGVIDEDIGLLLIVEKLPWANSLHVTRGVEEALDALRPGLPDVTIDDKIFRPATFIEMSIENLGNALVIAAFLVCIVLFLFLYEWRVALISCVAIPLSLTSAALVMYWWGVTINTMILAGLVIALGVVVDDAIVDIENIVRRMREARKEKDPKKRKSTFAIVLDSSLEVRNAIIYSSLIEGACLLPVFLMEGLSGAFFVPLATAYVLAMITSTTIALTVTPAMALVLLRNAPLGHREPPLMKFLQGGYDWLLSRIVKTPRPAYAVVGLIAISGALVVPRLGQELLPDFMERDFLMHWLAYPDASLTEENRITIKAGKELLTIPGVRNMGAHIGQALIMDEVYGVYFGENWVSLDPSVPYKETLHQIQNVVAGYPGIVRDVQTYLKERIREVLTGSSKAITVRLYGHDLDELRRLAEEVKVKMGEVDGVVDLSVESLKEIPQIKIKVDLEKAKQYAVSPGNVHRAVSRMINGQEAGDIHVGNRTWDVHVWSIPEARQSVTNVKEMLISTPNGQNIELQDVADVYVGPTPNGVNRENLKRKIDIGANVSGERDLGSVYRDVETALASIKFPHGFHPELLGEYTESLKAQSKMFYTATISLLVIFILLVTVLGSVKLAIISFLCLPAAMVGGVLAAYFGGGIISLGSMVGFLTILGIAARNGILMIDHFQHLEREEGVEFGPDLVLRGSRERLAPILMTSLCTGVALVPLVLAGQIPGNEIELPMAIVILGGLVTATLLNLFVIPSLYLRFGARRASEKPFAGDPQPAFAQP